VGYINYGLNDEGGMMIMDQESTHEFVKKIHEQQEKQKQNKQRQGNNQPTKKLPNEQH